MPTTASDIVVTLTGGSNNTNPNLSIGGNPSSYPISGNINNLFDNISNEQALSGHEDYRCIYIFNNNSSESIFNTRLYINEFEGNESKIYVGLDFSPENQRITINGNVSGGFFIIGFKPPNQATIEYRTVYFNSDPATWAENLKEQLLTIPTIQDINITVSGTFSSRIFDVSFQSIEDLRSHDLFLINYSSLIGTNISSSVTKIVVGSPINSIPALLDASTTIPYNVTFYETNINNQLYVGTLYPEEGFPLWIKRTTPINSNAIAGEGFGLKILGSPI